MWFDEPHPTPGERFSYQTERVGTAKLQRVIVNTTFLYLRDETGVG